MNNALRVASLTAVLLGAGGSIGFMFRVGHRNQSRLLLALFTIWVLSPFIALIWARVVSKRWPTRIRLLLDSLMLLIALGSLAVYGEAALGSPRTKPASTFLVVPLVSWLLIALAGYRISVFQTSNEHRARR